MPIAKCDPSVRQDEVSTAAVGHLEEEHSRILRARETEATSARVNQPVAHRSQHDARAAANEHARRQAHTELGTRRTEGHFTEDVSMNLAYRRHVSTPTAANLHDGDCAPPATTTPINRGDAGAGTPLSAVHSHELSSLLYVAYDDLSRAYHSPNPLHCSRNAWTTSIRPFHSAVASNLDHD